MNAKDTNRELVKSINDPLNTIDKHFTTIENARGISFMLCLGGTTVSDLEDISAAGANSEARRMTPRYDAEALVLGKTADGNAIPVSPLGIVSPVVLTKACLDLIDCQRSILDCGTFASPRVDSLVLGTIPAQCVSSGNALPIDHIEDLFERGLRLGREESKKSNVVVVGECVPGGTTTAMATLMGFGYEVNSFISSSLPNNNSSRRLNLVTEGLEKSGLISKLKTRDKQDPFFVLSALGDPMQPVAAGIAIGASQNATVVLAGGSQMLAVYQIASEIAKTMSNTPLNSLKENTLVSTTKWVAYDKSAKTPALARHLQAPLACSNFGLKTSRHKGLRAYEEGHVKEGVGAGASILLAHLFANRTEKELVSAIDETYDQLVKR